VSSSDELRERLELETRGSDTHDQPTLFGSDLDEFTLWRQEWRGMPEFVQDDLTPWKSVIVHFSCRIDMDAFAKLVEQKLTFKTPSVWYPESAAYHFMDKRYADES
jgi:hypothetical protein